MKRGLTSARPMSTRPPSALAGGTATRLTSAMHTNATVPNQRIGTAIGFAETVSHKSGHVLNVCIICIFFRVAKTTIMTKFGFSEIDSMHHTK